MKIAIDTGPLERGDKFRGIGVNTRELISSLNNLKDIKGVIQIYPVDFQSENLSKYDILHFTSFHPFTTKLSLIKDVKNIVTIHDLISLIYPKNYPPGMRGYLNFLKLKSEIKKADAIITISETSKKDIIRFLNIPPNNIYVIYLGVNKIFKCIRENKKYLDEVKKKYKLPEKFILYTGDVNYNKNLPNLVKACHIVKTPLVICGKQAVEIEIKDKEIFALKGMKDYLRFLFKIPHPELAHYPLLSKMIVDNNMVIRTGFVSDKELVAIYNMASVYCQPSLYEGFGLPVLEAMACRVPVVVSRTNAVTEIAGDAALVAKPNDINDLAEKLLNVINNKEKRNDLIEKGSVRVKEFSWDKMASQICDLYKRI